VRHLQRGLGPGQPAAQPRRDQDGAVPAEKLYGVNGLQYLPFNTLCQFAADAHVQTRGCRPY